MLKKSMYAALAFLAIGVVANAQGSPQGNMGAIGYYRGLFGGDGSLLAPVTPTDCSAPPYSFTGDTNTGVGYGGADTIQECAGGVAIGTWTTNRLTVTGNYAAGFGQLDLSPLTGQHGYLTIGAAFDKEAGIALRSGAGTAVWWLHRQAAADDRLQFDSAAILTFDLTQTGHLTLRQRDLGEPSGEAGGVITLVTNAINDDPTENFFQNRVTTTDATVTTIQSVTIPAATTVGINCTIVARRTGGASGTAEDGAYYEIKVAVKNVAGTATEIAAETLTVIGESIAGYTVTAAPSGANELIRVTGAATTNITWHSHCRTYPVGS